MKSLGSEREVIRKQLAPIKQGEDVVMNVERHVVGKGEQLRGYDKMGRQNQENSYNSNNIVLNKISPRRRKKLNRESNGGFEAYHRRR